MKKGSQKVYQTGNVSQSNNQNPSDPNAFQIENLDKYPNRLICYLKMKLSCDQEMEENYRKALELNVKGTGCLISNKYLLTAAHNMIDKKLKISKLSNLKTKFTDRSYIQQGLGLGDGGKEGEEKEQQQQKSLSKLNIKSEFINPKYETVMKYKQKSFLEDFGLIEIDSKSTNLKQDKFMPIVYLSYDAVRSIKSISIYGYPIEFNRSNSSRKDASSIYMKFQCGGSNQIKKYEKDFLSYSIQTQKGTSGAPIIAEYLGEHIIIGIHKAGDQSEEGSNKGVSAGQMIEVLNNYGYEQEKRPFVYTDRTLNLRDKQLSDRQILFLMDKGFQSFDVLVFTAFDLKNVKKIVLSGNQIGSLGVQFLLRRKYPNIKSLFLTQNRITSLDNIPEENWNHIQNISTLALNVNQLTSLPEGIMCLKKIEKLWLAQNRFKSMPEVLERYCKENDRESFSVYLYDNNINFQQQKRKISEFNKSKVRVVWSRQGQEKQAKTP